MEPTPVLEQTKEEPPADSIAESPLVADMFTEGSKVAVAIGASGSVGGQFVATTKFNAIEVSTPSWSNDIGSLTFSLYRFDSSYEKTVQGQPVMREEFVDFKDNAWIKLEHDSWDAGEYLWTLSNGVESVGVWKATSNYANIVSYEDGQLAEGSYYARVSYLDTPAVTFGEPSGGLDLSVKVTTPPQYQYPSDHALLTKDVYADTWTATDGLGRTLPGIEEAGEKRKDKFVGLFYWTWHYNFAPSTEPKNVNEIIKKNPEAIHDLNFSEWGPVSSPHFWNEPLFGYYDSTDRWVLRKHAEMLADAGVDVIFFDCTNGSYTWKPAYTALLEVFAEARSEGVKTPQIAFMLGFGPSDEALVALKQIYLDIYRNNKYQDLWFYWEDKPVIMAYPQKLTQQTADEKENKLRGEIKDFFTFRPGQPSYTSGDTTGDQWGWLSVYPQRKFGTQEDGSVEQMTVGVAQNHSAAKGLTAMNGTDVFGRSHTVQFGVDKRKDSKLYGANFAEQWDYALDTDPDFIFITGWNEWVAGRHETWGGVTNAFPDQFNDEYSRDVEPSKGELKDHYYYQMVSYIRKFKGVRPAPAASGSKTINLSSTSDEWEDVRPEFRSYKGNTKHRDADGYKGTHYTNTTGRNDIVLSKVTYDAKNVYFMVETAEDLTAKTDKAWMRLFIDTKSTGSSNWEGYEFVVNRVNPNGKAIVEASTGGWKWKEVAQADYAIKGKRVEIAIPREALGLLKAKIDIQFKWADNMQNEGDIMDFYQFGDAAPSGRFNYRFVTKK